MAGYLMIQWIATEPRSPSQSDPPTFSSRAETHCAATRLQSPKTQSMGLLQWCGHLANFEEISPKS